MLSVDFIKHACFCLSHVFTLDGSARVDFWPQHGQVMEKHLRVNDSHSTVLIPFPQNIRKVGFENRLPAKVSLLCLIVDRRNCRGRLLHLAAVNHVDVRLVRRGGRLCPNEVILDGAWSNSTLHQACHVGRLGRLLGFVGCIISPVLLDDLVGDGLDFGLISPFLLYLGCNKLIVISNELKVIIVTYCAYLFSVLLKFLAHTVTLIIC